MSAQLQVVDNSLNLNTRLIESTNGYINLSGEERDKAWEIAKDVVDYPVRLENAFYQNKRGELVNANGETNTGRDKYFNLVIVDKFRDGDEQAIAAVSNQYSSLITSDTYRDLKEHLEESGKDYDLVGVFVTGNGGSQSLEVEVKGMAGMEGLPDDLAMRVRLCTSVDGTKSHTLSLIAHNKTGDTSAAVYGGEHRLTARHTKTITERAIDFAPHITKMIKNWNELIIPTMILMFDKKYDHEMAKDLLDSVAEDAGIGERHRQEIRRLYESGNVRTNDKTDSLYKIQTTLTQYVDDELEDKKELQERFKAGIAKAINKEVRKIK